MYVPIMKNYEIVLQIWDRSYLVLEVDSKLFIHEDINQEIKTFTYW